jgi:hypothetical protein
VEKFTQKEIQYFIFLPVLFFCAFWLSADQGKKEQLKYFAWNRRLKQRKEGN